MSDRTEEFVHAMRSALRVCYVNRRGTEMSVRCPYCGDSRKDLSHAHLNIRLDGDLLVFRCVRCECSGVVTSAFVRDLSVYDHGVMEIAFENQKEAGKRTDRVRGKSGAFREMKIPVARTPEALDRLGYVCERLGVDISPERAAKRFKMVTDFRELFRHNKWMKPTQEDYVMRRLADEGVGFVSSDWSSIIFRDVTGGWKKRYHNYPVHPGDPPGASTMYSVQNEVDVTALTLKVSMTEGIFDILGVALNVDDSWDRDDEHVLLATNGKSFIPAIRNLRSKGFLDLDLRIYSDNDVKEGLFRWIKREDPLLKYRPFQVFWNVYPGQKDFGVERSKIRVKKAVL